MTLVMTFLINKISSQFIKYLEKPDAVFNDQNLAGTFITLTCLVSIVGIIITLSVAHKEFNLPFTFLNFIIAIFFVSLPLFISADIINSSFSFSELDPDKEVEAFQIGMSLFIFTFISLLIYLIIVSATQDSIRIPKIKYLQIGGFHLAAIAFGIICLFIFKSSRVLMFFSFAALMGSAFYLYFLWTTKQSLEERSMPK
jgi:hypothetical protein